MRKIKVPGHEADFWLYHSGPPNNSGTKGIAIAVNARAKLALMDWDPLSDRIMRARFAGSPFNLTVIAVYAPTTLAEEDEKDLFYDELQRVFSSIPNNDIVILAGDWNAQLGPGDINTRHIIGRYGLGERCVNGERLLNFADFNRLVVASTMFQHKRRHLVTWYSNDGHTANQIDHLLTNSRWATSVKDCRSYRGAETGNKHGSDHVLVRASIKLRLSRTHSSKGSQRLNIAALHTDGVHDRLVSDISDGLAAGTTQYDNLTPLEGKWKLFKETIQRCSNNNLGMSSHSRADWISDATIDLYTLGRDLRIQGSIRYKDIRKQAARSARSDRNKYWSERADSMERASNVGDIGMLYRIIRETTGNRKQAATSLRASDGQLLSAPSAVSNRWAEYFGALLNHSPTNTLIVTDRIIEYPVECDPPTLNEIKLVIDRLRSSTCPGEDGIPTEIYKTCQGVLLHPLHELYSLVWLNESCPTDWGSSILIPVFKKGDKTVCSNYRGISMIDAAAKIFAKILVNRLNVERENRIRHSQAGFRPGRGCTDHLFSLRRILEHRSKYQQTTIACFIDFRAAFDSIDRECLWRILRADGVPEKLVKIIRAYYSATSAQVRTGGNLSNAFPLTSGVRQGCALSPMLFNWVIDWVMDRALAGYRGVQIGEDDWVSDLVYADDIVIVGDAVHAVQSVLNQLSNIAASVGLGINADKTKFFAHEDSSNLSLEIEGHDLERVQTFKYLGASFQPNGQTVEEIKARVDKSRVVSWQLRKAVFNRRELSLRTKIRIYQASVRSVLLYGCDTWTLRAEDLRNLDRYDNWCMRSLLRVRLSDRIPVEEIRRRCFNISSLNQVLSSRRLRWFGHVLRRDPEEITRRTLFATQCRSWKAKQYGQYKTWIRTIKKDIEKLGLSAVSGIRRWNKEWLNICSELASDRKAWRASIRDILAAD